MKKIIGLFIMGSSLISGLYAQEKVDIDAINTIKKEGLDNSKVMDIAFHLTDVSGSRLTNSPGYFRAANWARTDFFQDATKNLYSWINQSVCLKFIYRIYPQKFYMYVVCTNKKAAMIFNHNCLIFCSPCPT